MFDRPVEGSFSRLDKPFKDSPSLKKAYDTPSGLYHDDLDRTLYIAGTKSLADVRDDLLIPLRKVEMSDRYKDAVAYLKDHPEIETIVGHSLGGSVALQLQKDKPYGVGYKTRTYGAPVLDLSGKPDSHRFRHFGDPVSVFDSAATVRSSSTQSTSYGKSLALRDIPSMITTSHSFEGYG
jgi:hypothetical protein